MKNFIYVLGLVFLAGCNSHSGSDETKQVSEKINEKVNVAQHSTDKSNAAQQSKNTYSGSAVVNKAHKVASNQSKSKEYKLKKHHVNYSHDENKTYATEQKVKYAKLTNNDIFTQNILEVETVKMKFNFLDQAYNSGLQLPNITVNGSSIVKESEDSNTHIHKIDTLTYVGNKPDEFTEAQEGNVVAYCKVLHPDNGKTELVGYVNEIGFDVVIDDAHKIIAGDIDYDNKSVTLDYLVYRFKFSLAIGATGILKDEDGNEIGLVRILS